jgi:ABC-2 type transport system permease protein
MKKAFTIGWKDLSLVFRDRAALIMMLAAPFVLTLGMGFVGGRFSASSGQSGLRDIRLTIYNQDAGPLGQALVDILTSESLAELLSPSLAQDEGAARQPVDDNQAAAAVIIPAGFSASVIPDPATGALGPLAQVEVYANPARPVSAGLVRSVVERFASQVESGRVGGQVIATQLIETGLLAPQAAVQASQAYGQQVAAGRGGAAIALRTAQAEPGEAPEFDMLAFFAPGMAIFFLMYTVSHGGRSLLAERDNGTLARLLSTPTSGAQVLGGKVFGIFLTGAAQVGILIMATSLLFGLRWGDPLAMAVLVLATVAGATGWGLLLTAFARTPGQVASLGSAMMLLFGILSGTFVPSDGFPTWLRWLAGITPNVWGMSGFTRLATGGGLADIAQPVGALLAMAVVLFSIAVAVFGRARLLAR